MRSNEEMMRARRRSAKMPMASAPKRGHHENGDKSGMDTGRDQQADNESRRGNPQRRTRDRPADGRRHTETTRGDIPPQSRANMVSKTFRFACNHRIN